MNENNDNDSDQQAVDAGLSEKADPSDAFAFRLTGMVTARVCRFDEETAEFVDTEEFRDVYFEELAGMTGQAAKWHEAYRITARECREFVDG